MIDSATYFRHLGKSLLQQWAVHAYARPVFPELAESVLRAMPAHEHVDPIALLAATAADRAATSTGSSESFGQPAIPVYTDDRIHIEVLYWFAGSPGIHQHGFHGAFQVLSGSSIHARYAFTRENVISPQFILGTTKFLEIEQLSRGDIRRIPPGDQFIHALYHLAHPSTTVVIRTHMDPEFMPTLFYAPPHVAIDGFLDDRSLRLRARTIAAIAQADPSTLDRATAAAIASASPLDAYLMLSEFFHHCADRDRRHEMLDGPVRRAHGEIATLLAPVLDNQQRIAALIRKRTTVNDIDQRYFLALLLNCPDATSLREMLARRYPTDDPDVRANAMARALDVEDQLAVLLAR